MRQRLAKLAGIKRLDLETVTELFVLVQVHAPLAIAEAIDLVKSLRS